MSPSEDNDLTVGRVKPIERVMLTGAAGFVGSHLADRLVAMGLKVEGVDNFITGRRENLEHLMDSDAFTLTEADVSVPFEPGEAPDLVLHFACPASPKDYMRYPIETMLVDSYGTHNTLEIARKAGARYMIASTSEVYGDPEVHPQPEDYWGNVNPIGPRSVYDEAKRFSEALTCAYAREHGIDVRVSRIFNTYGPRMRLDDGRVVPAFVGQALAGAPLTVFGDGSQTRTFCFVGDTVEALLRFALHPGLAGEVINIGGIDERTILDFAVMVKKLFGPQSPIEHYPAMTDDPKRRKPDITKARGLLDWKPLVSFEDGLQRTADSFARRDI